MVEQCLTVAACIATHANFSNTSFHGIPDYGVRCQFGSGAGVGKGVAVGAKVGLGTGVAVGVNVGLGTGVAVGDMVGDGAGVGVT